MKKKRYIKVEVPGLDAEKKEWVPALFADLSISGIEEKENGVEIFGAEGTLEVEEIVDILEKKGLEYQLFFIEDQNWNAVWESSFEPVVVEDQVCIRASFHEAPKTVKYDLVITPKMSFGTGHHATTWLMVKAMAEMDFASRTVIDFGTGTGVLAIFAEKLGAIQVEAIDIDEWSVANALENCTNNECRNVIIRQDNQLKYLLPADVVLANINRNILLENMVSLVEKTREGGSCLMSGLLEGDREIISNQAVASGFQEAGYWEKDGWIALLFRKN